MEEEVKGKNSKKVSIIIIASLLVVLITVGVIYFFHGNNVIEYDDFIYKIRYDFGCESYIYYLKDGSIKTVDILPETRVIPDCDCIEETGEYDYQEKDIVFTPETKNKVINTFDTISKRIGKNEYNADEIDLSEYEKRILLAVMVSDENMITIEDNIHFDTVTTNTNSKTILDNNTSNKYANEMADYINGEIDKEFNSLNENDSISLNVKLSFIGKYLVSFVYTKENQTGVSETKGYNLRYVGGIYEYPAGIKSKYYESTINEFKKSEYYSENIISGWEEIL